jgi:hypothetical protein
MVASTGFSWEPSHKTPSSCAGRPFHRNGREPHIERARREQTLENKFPELRIEVVYVRLELRESFPFKPSPELGNSLSPMEMRRMLGRSENLLPAPRPIF